MTVDTKELVTKVAYMIGIKKEILQVNYDFEILEEFFQNQDMTYNWKI